MAGETRAGRHQSITCSVSYFNLQSSGHGTSALPFFNQVEIVLCHTELASSPPSVESGGSDVSSLSRMRVEQSASGTFSPLRHTSPACFSISGSLSRVQKTLARIHCRCAPVAPRAPSPRERRKGVLNPSGLPCGGPSRFKWIVPRRLVRAPAPDHRFPPVHLRPS